MVIPSRGLQLQYSINFGSVKHAITAVLRIPLLFFGVRVPTFEQKPLAHEIETTKYDRGGHLP